MIGSILFGLGLFLSSFAKSLSLLFFTIGVLVAVGHSFCQAASMFVLPHFFGNNYAMPLGIALSGASTGALALSSLKELIFRKFAFKTGMQILSGTALILLLCGITFKPPKGSFHIKGGQACNPKSQKLLIFCGQVDHHEINTHTKFYFKIFCCSKNRAF